MIGKRRRAPVRARAAFFISPRNFCAALAPRHIAGRAGVLHTAPPNGLLARRTVKRRARLRAERQGAAGAASKTDRGGRGYAPNGSFSFNFLPKRASHRSNVPFLSRERSHTTAEPMSEKRTK